jgi:hypothetical protein
MGLKSETVSAELARRREEVRMRMLIAGTFAVTLVSSCATAFAQTPAPLPPEPDMLTFTPFVGPGFGGDLESSPVAFGAALGYGLTPKWVLEGELSLMPDASEGDVTEFDATAWGLSANLLYHFSAERVTPYVAAGVGVLNAHADLEEAGLLSDDTSTAFAWNWGGGLKSAVNDQFGLRADMRYFTMLPAMLLLRAAEGRPGGPTIVSWLLLLPPLFALRWCLPARRQ